jgi:NAD(P)-dependent dehydrogenase (short-subunit alcohol dehydrogenase family)
VSAVVVGVGPGIGQAVARRFATEGLAVALVARSRTGVEAVATAVGGRTLALTADVIDPDGIRTALDKAAAELGPPEIVVYNAGLIQPHSVEDPVAEHLRAWHINVGGAITVAGHVLPGMAARGRGTFIITGGMPEPVPAYLSLSIGKAAVRSLTEALHRQYGPAGVHVATVTVGGTVAPGTAFDPDDIAGHYWRLSRQPRSDWQTHVPLLGPLS